MIRLIVFSLILAIFAAAVAVSIKSKPLQPLIIDAQSPGAWPQYAAAPDGEAPANMLVLPCPLTPKNLPIADPDWKA